MNVNNEPSIILIVEDNPLNLRMLEEALGDEYILRIACDAEQAITLASEHPRPDLILLDIILPEIDGFELCKLLKKTKGLRQIPVIFITALLKESDEEKGITLGAIDYIRKPFNIPVIKAKIKNHIELKKLRDMFRESAMIDGLTKIANKKKFNESLEIEWRRCLRNKKSISILLLDIDFFKSYNDTYGHLKGDECIKIIAYTIKKQLFRSSDLAARWGGEEFACILPETSQKEANLIAERIRLAIEDIRIVHKESLVSDFITVSIGYAGMVPDEETSWEKLIEQADRGLYQAKAAGRNCVKSYEI